MKPLYKILMTSLGIIPFLLPLDTAKAETRAPGEMFSSAEELPWKKARFMVETQTGTRSIGTVDAFVPFMGDDDFLVYANLIAKYGTGASNANGNTFEGNFGLGFRRVNDAENAIFGAYVFYDSLRSVNDNQFTQVTVGVERLGLTWDFRANAYLPMGKTKYDQVIHSGGTSVVEGHDVIEYVKSRKEFANAGGDLEVGRTLGSDKLRGYFAVYSFGNDLTGPRARLEYKLTNNITFTTTAQYDKERDGQFFLGARFALGGAKASNKSIYNRMTDIVVRDVDIVTKTVDTDLTRIAKDKVWVVDPEKGTDKGDGTFESPFSYIDDAIEAAPEGTHIIVMGKDGDIYRVRDEITLQQGQHIWGGIEDLYYNYDLDTFTSATDKDAHKVADGNGVRPNLGGNIRMADNTSLNNLDITADSINDSRGVMIYDAHNVSINNVNVFGFNQTANDRGIAINNSTDVHINNVTLDGNYIGIDIKDSDVVSNHLNIVNSTSDGMIINNGVQTHNDLSIENSGGVGVHMFAGLTTLNNIRLDGNVLAGILLENNAADGEQFRSLTIDGDANSSTEGEEETNAGWTIKNTKSSMESSNDGYGIWVKDYSFLNANHGALTNNKGHGLNFEKGVFTLNDMHISGNKMGIYVGEGDRSNAASTLTNSVIEKNSSNGISLAGGRLIANDVTVNDNLGHGLQINHGSIATVLDGTFNGNGLDTLIDAHNPEDLISGIQILDGTLNAKHIIVEKNAGGIELIKGTLAINDNLGGAGETSRINDNTGYGVYAHGIGDNDANARVIRISNTEINNNLKVSESAYSGFGIYAQDVDNINLQQVTINNNAAGGIKALSQTRDLQLSIIDGKIRDNQDGAGINVAGVSSTINLVDVTIAHNAGAGLVSNSQTNSTLTANNLNINNNAAEGIKLTAQNSITMNINNSYINYNTMTGIQAISKQSNVDLSMMNGEVKGNKLDGINLRTETEVAIANGNNITSHVNLNGTKVMDNEANGINIEQRTSATAMFTFNKSTITNNKNGGLYITRGILDGTNIETIIQSNNHIDYTQHKGDFANF